MTTIRDMQAAVHSNARRKGFYDGAQDSNAEIAMRLALVHSEVSEALEAMRDEGALRESYTQNGKPVGFASELADVVIRVMDMAEWLGVDLQAEIEAKHAYNQGRPSKHGKAF